MERDLSVKNNPGHRQDFLTWNMHEQMGNKGSCFEFLVQRQEDACDNPIEDPTFPWGSTWRQVATLYFPKQEFMYRDQQQFCDDLSFNPWHSLPEHKPLGQLNRVRAEVYTKGNHSNGVI